MPTTVRETEGDKKELYTTTGTNETSWQTLEENRKCSEGNHAVTGGARCKERREKKQFRK